MPASDSTTPMKTCTKCSAEYPATPEYFHADKRSRNGLRSDCKGCNNAAKTKWNKQHPEQHRASQKRWREENYEHLYAEKKRWQEEHREKRRVSSQQWNKQHPEVLRASSKQWRETHPEKVAANSRNRKARQRAAEGTHTAADIAAQHQRQKGRCYYCGCKLTKTPRQSNSATVDHVVPLDRGGRNDPSNLVIACLFCNSSKSNKLPHEWTQGGKLL